MGFNRDKVSALLVAVHRRCCICHRFCGCKIETDHILPEADGGTDEIENAIPVCFECHAEIHSYNNRHPRGRKFMPAELQTHKEQWLDICRKHPELFVAAVRTADVGPLQALIDELEFNMVVSNIGDGVHSGAIFADEQFRRAIGHGSISMLEPELKTPILAAYAAMSRANQRIFASMNPDGHTRAWTDSAAQDAIKNARPLVKAAHEQLLGFLGKS